MELHGRHLIIFGCGYVGTALAQAAKRSGARVTALTRNHAAAEALRRSGVAEVCVADLAAGDWHARMPSDVDLAVVCVSSGGGGTDGYRSSYVDGMRSVLHWTAGRNRPLETLLYTSSTSVYPQGGGEVIDETKATEGGSERARILMEAENQLRAAPPTACLRSFILRLAGIYGPGRHHLLDQLRTGAGTLPGSPGTRLNLAHRDDIVAAILACLGSPMAAGCRTYNVADGRPSTRREVADWLCGQLGRSPVRFTGGTTGAHRDGGETPDRIIASARLQAESGWRPRHGDFRSGYADLLRQV